MIRKTLFWTHLVVGIVSGLVVFVLCATGAILSFEKPIVDWAERDARAAPPSSTAEWLSPDVLLANAAKVNPSSVINMEWLSDAKMPVRLRLKDQTWIMLNGYTGDVLGRGAASLRGFFSWITTFHVSLSMKLTGEWITGVADAVFVFLIFSGLYLWWPRQWRWKVLRNSIAIRFKLGSKARDWNWHNAFGFWFLPPLLFMAASGLVLSFKSVDQWWRKFGSSHFLVAALHPPSPAQPPPKLNIRPKWNDLMRTVQQNYPHWRTIQGTPAPFAKPGVVTLIVRMGYLGQLTHSYTIKIDKASNTILNTMGWAEMEASNRARAIARVGHTGEILGLWGQALALAGCLAGCLLVYTGFALSWRRFFCIKGLAASKIEEV